MAKLSKTSQARLKTCDPKLQAICNELITRIDFTVLCGARTEAEQNRAFEEGHSLLKYPESKHNSVPSKAVDLAPYPIDWSNLDKFHDLAKAFKKVAEEQGIAISWGGDWKKFKDYPHFELKE